MTNICLVRWLQFGTKEEKKWPDGVTTTEYFPHEPSEFPVIIQMTNLQDIVDVEGFICKHCGLVYSIKEEDNV